MKTYTELEVQKMLESMYSEMMQRIDESQKKELTAVEHSYRNGLLQGCIVITSKMMAL